MPPASSSQSSHDLRLIIDACFGMMWAVPAGCCRQSICIHGRDGGIVASMTQEIHENDKPMPRFVPNLKRGAVLALVLFAGLVAAMAATLWIQRTVHLYHPLVFEDAARKALEAEDYQKTVNICTGNLNYTGRRLSTHGMAHLLRAKAYFGLNEVNNAAEDIAEAEAFWRVSFRDADALARQELKQFATEVGLRFLKTGDTEKALQLFSLAGTGSGKPIQYMHELKEQLGNHSEQIWPSGPFLIVEDFERPDCTLFSQWHEKTGRKVEISRVVLDQDVPTHAVQIKATVARKKGLSWYYIPFFMEIPKEACRVRTTMLVKKGAAPEMRLYLFYPETDAREYKIEKTASPVEGDRYAVEVALPGRTSDESVGQIIRIMLVLPPEECEYLVEHIILLPGDGKESGEHGQE
jgi:hypothetical protein